MARAESLTKYFTIFIFKKFKNIFQYDLKKLIKKIWFFGVPTWTYFSNSSRVLNVTQRDEGGFKKAKFCVTYFMNGPLRNKNKFVRSGIRTHAHRSGLRPERSALDRSAILTLIKWGLKLCFWNIDIIFH